MSGRALAVAVAVLAGACTAPHDTGWAVSGSVSQRVEVDTNRDENTSPAPTYGAKSRLGLTVARETSAAAIEIRPSLSLSAFGGPGDPGDLNRVDPGLSGSLTLQGRRLTLTSELEADAKPTSETQVLDTGIVDQDTTQLSVRVSAELAYALDPRNRTTLAGTASLVRFTDEGTLLTPTTVYGLTAGWTHALDAATNITLSTGVSRFSADDASGTRALTFDMSGAVTHQFHPRLSGSARLGATLTRTVENAALGGRSAELEPGLSVLASLDWEAAPDTRIGLSLSQGLEASAAGELQTVRRAAINVEHDVNSRIRLGLGLSYSGRARSGSGQAGNANFSNNSDTINLETTLGYQLAQHWRANIGHVLHMTRRDQRKSLSNLVFLDLSHDFELLR